MPNEAMEPVLVCDGGKAFWGIVYNIQTSRIEEIEYNGYA